MRDRKPALYGGALLAIAVMAVGIFWFQAQEGPAAPPPPLDAASAGTLFGPTAPSDPDGAIAVAVYLSPTCGCCGLWVEHMTRAGFAPELRYMSDAELGAVKEQLGIRPEHASCHTAVVGGYVVEGHVPAEVVHRLLAEAPEGIRGITAPGMPVNSPGMEVPGMAPQPYDVLTFNAEGRTTVYSREGRNE